VFVALPVLRDYQTILNSVRRRVAHLSLAMGVDPASSTGRAAVLLLAANAVGQSVHRLAMLTGEPSEFVARCARRLVDNGVWQGGETVALWTRDEFDVTSFWADVAVAEGRLCRRVDESREFHWAPPGQWWKEFDYFSRSESREVVTKYRPRTEPAPVTLDELRAAIEADEPEPVAAASPSTAGAFGKASAPGGAHPMDVLILGARGSSGDAVWLA
jgi:hypothetical protein